MAKLTPEMIEEAKRKDTTPEVLPKTDGETIKQDFIKAVLTDDYITLAEGIADGTIEIDAPSKKTYKEAIAEIPAIHEDCVRVIKAGNIKWSPSYIRSRLDVADLDIIAIRTLFSREQTMFAEFMASKATSTQKKAAKRYHALVLAEKASFDKLDAQYSNHNQIEALITQVTTPSKR